MKNNLIFIAEIFKDRRYWIVAFLLFVPLIFGKNILGDSGIAGDPDKNIFYGGEYTIKDHEEKIEIGMIDVSPGEIFRVGLSAKTADPANKIVDDQKNDKPTKIKIAALSSLGERQEIGELDIARQFSSGEFYFKSNIESHSLQILSDATGDVFIKDLYVTKMKIDELAKIASLKPTILGKTDDSKITNSWAGNGTDYAYKLMSKKKLVGQIFKAESNAMSSVSFKMNFIGHGGRFGYNAELYPAVYDGNKFVIENSPTNSYYFSPLYASTALKEPGEDDDVFRFPLFSNLEKGKYYFVGIRNLASINILNHLELLGTSSDVDGSSHGVTVGLADKNVTEVGDFYFKIYSADLVIGNNLVIPNGTLIEDLGQNEGRYQYLQEKDNLRSAIVKKTEDETIYQFNTVYPFREVSISFDFNQDLNFPVMSYSSDSINWTPLDYDESSIDGIDPSDKKRLRQIVSGNGGSNTFFIKVMNRDGIYQVLSNLHIVGNLIVE